MMINSLIMSACGNVMSYVIACTLFIFLNRQFKFYALLTYLLITTVTYGRYQVVFNSY